MSKLKVYNFNTLNVGELVRRSPHHKREHFGRGSKQIGVITDKKFYADANGHIRCWPVIHWEKSLHGTIVHPVNAVPFRSDRYNKNHFIEMAE